MRRKLNHLGVTLLVALLSLSFTSLARADAREYFKCKLTDGTEGAALEELANDFMKIARAEGFKDYSMEFLWPLFSQDISRGSFYWSGKAPNAARIGALNDFWEGSKANADIRARFRKMATCETSSLYMTTEIK